MVGHRFRGRGERLAGQTGEHLAVLMLYGRVAPVAFPAIDAIRASISVLRAASETTATPWCCPAMWSGFAGARRGTRQCGPDSRARCLAHELLAVVAARTAGLYLPRDN